MTSSYPLSSYLRRARFAFLASACLALTLSAAEPARKNYELPSGDATVTLKQFAEQSGEQVIFLVNEVRGVATKPVSGGLTAREALEAMLADTSLVVVQDEKTGALSVNRRPARPAESSNGSQSQPQSNNPSSRPVRLPAGDDGTIELEEFTVTGSFIRRLDEEKTLPITSIGGEDMAVRGVSTAIEFMTSIPQMGRVPVGESGNGGAGIRGDIATANLRSIGSGNTLVLLNGRRLAPHPITGDEGGAPFLSVNVNVIPTAAVEKIEVLRDGASAIYGTDASAGVINNILRRIPSGVVVTTRYADTHEGGGRELRGSVATGVTLNRGNGNLTLMYDYFDRTEIKNTDREWSRSADQRWRAPAPWDGSTALLNADYRSAHGFYGRFQRGTMGSNGAFTGSRPATGVTATEVAANGTFYFVPTPAGGGARTWQAAQPDQTMTSPVYDHFLDINEYQYLLPASRRHNFYLAADNRFSDRLTLFGEATHYRAHSRNQRESTRHDSFVDNNVLVSRDNPYNPFGSRFYSPTGAPNADGTPRLVGAPSDVLIGRLTLGDMPPRSIIVKSEATRAVAGARGEISADWSWESAFLYSFATTADHEHNSVKENQFRDAVARTDNTAYNPFGTTFQIVNGAIQPTGQRFVNPQSVLSGFTGIFVHEGETSVGSWDIRVNGSLWDLPAGRIGIAAGGEIRRETFFDYRDPESGRLTAEQVAALGYRPQLAGDNNFLQQSPTDNTRADRDVQAGFVEMVVPFFGAANRRPGLQLLELSLAARHENYSDFGGTTKPKVGVAWRSVDWLMVRGSFNQGFRAPTLASLFSGNLSRAFQSATDTYRFEVTGLIDDGPSGRRRANRSGNRALRPEEAETYTAGIVMDVPFVKGLSFTVDWWQIKQTDSIGGISANDSLIDDNLRIAAENARLIAAGQSPNQIDLSGAGNPLVIRNPVTPADRDAFAAYNATRPPAQQRAPVGTMIYIIEPYINAPSRELSGIDYSASYRFPPTSFGQFNLRADASWLGRNELRESPTGPVIDERWLDGRSKWKGNASLHWRHGDWAAGLFANYVGGYRDSGLITTTFKADYISEDGYYIVDDALTYNVSLSKNFRTAGWLEGTTVRLGVNNLFNTDPPYAPGSRGTRDGDFEVRGRAYYLELSKRF